MGERQLYLDGRGGRRTDKTIACVINQSKFHYISLNLDANWEISKLSKKISDL